MAIVRANGIEICYEALGHGEPMLLIAGLGMQLVSWDRDFCTRLASCGFRVIRFDNRDAGLSSKLDHLPTMGMGGLLWRSITGIPVLAPYSLRDMADDAIGLLDALGVQSAHLAGASMGGMIAQIMAIRYGHRVRSLTSIMSHPGDPLSKVVMPRALRVFLRAAPHTRDEAIRRYIETFRAIGSPGRYRSSEDRLRRRAEQAYERSFHPRGILRQTAAIAAARNRIAALRRVRVPALVLHGSCDPLVPLRGGRATARAIPGARLRIIDGMGHDLPPGAWPVIIDAIADIASSPRRARSQ